MSQKKVGDKLSHISPAGAVASLTEGDVHGWYNSYAYFNQHVSLDDLGIPEVLFPSGLFQNSRGNLPYYRSDGTQVFAPYERFNGCGIVLAKDRNYSPEHTESQAHIGLDFYRMYYHPHLRLSELDSSDTWPLPDYRFSTIASDLAPPGSGAFAGTEHPELVGPGGYLFNYAESGGQWSLNIGGIEYNQDYFFQFGGAGEEAGDLNSDNFTSTADLLQFLNSYDYNQSLVSLYGGPAPSTGPMASGTGGGYREVMLEPPSYPNGGLLSSEMVSYPQKWSMLIHDGTRNSTFGISLSALSGVIAQIIGTLDLSGVSGGSVNLTMPLLTTSQLNSLYTVSSGGDLNADGSVSTADLLEFLTAFGSVGGGAEVTGRLFDSFFLYHSGSTSYTYPFYSLGTEFLEQENDPLNFQTSLGTIDLTSALPWEYLDPVVFNGPFNQLYLENPVAAEINYRMYHMAVNNFAVHTSPSYGGLYGQVENFPPLQFFWMKAKDFDDLISYFNILGQVRYEEFLDSNNLQILNALNLDFEDISFASTADTASIPSPPHLFENGNQGGNYLRFQGLAAAPIAYADIGGKIIVECRGYVTCETGHDPTVAIFVRNHIPGLAGEIVPIGDGGYLGGEYVGFLGRVDMSQGYEVVDGQRVKEFTMEMDPGATQGLPFYTADEWAAMRSFGLNNTPAPAYIQDFTLGAITFFDTATSVVFTSVAYRLKNSRHVTP